jgi:perosamine synthetase
MIRRDFIPMGVPVLGEEELRNVTEAVTGGWISSRGRFVRDFEIGFAKYCAADYAVAVSSGTAALHLALAITGIGPGDEVILPAITHISAINAVTYQGGNPVLVDCEPDAWCIDGNAIGRVINERTRAIIAVHLYGQVADIPRLREIAEPLDIVVIEDAAQAHGATLGKRKAGSLGHIACFSFYSNKIITTGEGGMITTNDQKLADKAARLRDQAHEQSHRFVHRELGYNYRMTNLQAAIGVAQLPRLEGFIHHRRVVAQRYCRHFAGVSGLTLPVERPDCRHVHWVFAMVVDEGKFGKSRDQICFALRERGIDSRPFFYSANKQPLYAARFHDQSFPVSERLARDGINLPCGNDLQFDEVDHIAATILAMKKSK